MLADDQGPRPRPTIDLARNQRDVQPCAWRKHGDGRGQERGHKKSRNHGESKSPSQSCPYLSGKFDIC